MTSTSSTCRYRVGTSDGSWQDVQNSRGRQGYQHRSVSVLWETSLRVSKHRVSACTPLTPTSAPQWVLCVLVTPCQRLPLRGILCFCRYGCVQTSFWVYSFLFNGLNYKTSISALRQSVGGNPWKCRNCRGFYNGRDFLPPSVLHASDLYVLPTVILFLFFNGEGISSISDLVTPCLLLKKHRAKRVLQREASGVLVSSSLGLFQVWVEV